MVKSFFELCFRESTIHGLPYLVKAKTHWTEKLFWLIVAGIGMFFTFDICWGQWQRYRTNPTVLAIENNYQSWMYDPIGVTICSNYVNWHIMDDIINTTWNVDANDSKYVYYQNFLYTLSQLRYNNLSSLKEFANDYSIKNQDLLNLTKNVRFNQRAIYSKYMIVITEMGVCLTTSSLYGYQDIYEKRNLGNLKHLQTEKEVKCRVMDECKTSVVPIQSDGDHILIYLHNNNDIMSPEFSVRADILGKSTNDITINVQEIVASEKLRNLSPHSRQCLFYDESSIPYFQVYTPTLCRVNCRMGNALKLCGCRPFFYTTGPGKVCDIDGMICLSNQDWYNSSCNCPDLCSSVNYYKSYTNIIEYDMFQRMLTITLKFPKTRIKRRIVFSVDQMIVGFGGAAALFLGFSFLSGIELVFFFCEYVASKFHIKL